MRNLEKKKRPMPTQDPLIRKSNFDEVSKGYGLQDAMEEAHRCFHCPHRPCVSGCPVRVAIPDFLALLSEGKVEEAYEKILENSTLPAICGRVCPQEVQCESQCVRGKNGEPVAIGRLERFVADYHFQHGTSHDVKIKRNGHKVAIVGSGPAGLSCAGDLAKRGYDVTIFEALHVAGGVLVYGIPEFRLPKAIVEKELHHLQEMGVTIETNVVIGKTVTIDELMKEYGFEAVFIGSGAGLPRFMGIPGEQLKNVYSANEFLTRSNLMKAYQKEAMTPIYHGRKVAVIGGGNVAMDAARTALRLNAKVIIVYRRGKEELPARKEEIEHALEEGIQFSFLTNPVEILGDEKGAVKGLKVVSMELQEADASGRRRPVVIEGSEHVLEVDSVILAIGTSPNPLLPQATEGLQVDARGGIITDEKGRTSKEGVFAGGDAVTGAATVILAMGAGKTCAQSIDEYLCKKEK